jgi:hypothetical protein
MSSGALLARFPTASTTSRLPEAYRAASNPSLGEGFVALWVRPDVGVAHGAPPGAGFLHQEELAGGEPPSGGEVADVVLTGPVGELHC